jgi:hypothetical protein
VKRRRHHSAADDVKKLNPNLITSYPGDHHRSDEIHRGGIDRCVPRDLGGSPTSYDLAVSTALTAFHSAPAGPNWVMLLSDGTHRSLIARSARCTRRASTSAASPSGTARTATPGVRSTRCPGATGARWLVAPSPANLAAQLTHAQPDGIANVSVSIGGTSLAADIDPVGGWRAKFGLGKGTYTATATATLTSGHQIRVSRSFSVAAAGGGPVPGTVTPGTGAQRATVIHANRPAPHCSALPATVTGTVGKLRAGSLVITRRLNGAIVALQGRKSVGAPWVTLDRDKVQGGKYSLHWTRTADAGRTAGLRALCGKQQRGAEGSHSGLRGHELVVKHSRNRNASSAHLAL